MAVQEENIKALDEFAIKLLEGQHYAADDVPERRALLIECRALLMKKVVSEEQWWKTPTNTNSLRNTVMKQNIG